MPRRSPNAPTAIAIALLHKLWVFGCHGGEGEALKEFFGILSEYVAVREARVVDGPPGAEPTATVPTVAEPIAAEPAASEAATAERAAAEAVAARPAAAGLPATPPAVRDAAPAVTDDISDAERLPRRVPVPVLRPPARWCKPTGVTLGGGRAARCARRDRACA